MDAPEADIAVDAALAADLVAEQHPDLAGPVRFAASGWDTVSFRLGDDLAVRLPRRRLAAALVAKEQRWLPEVAELVSLPVPAPVRAGVPSARFPHPWSIVPWFAGTPVAETPVIGRAGIASALAAFLSELAVPAPRGAPGNPVRGVPLAVRDGVVRERLARTGLRRLSPLWDDALAAEPWAGPALWLHGDLHPGNLITAAGGGLEAVIDFGDLAAGDPATDLATAWLSFDEHDRALFRGALEKSDDASWRRARGWALVMASAMVDTVSGDGPIARVGRHTLAQLSAEAIG